MSRKTATTALFAAMLWAATAPLARAGLMFDLSVQQVTPTEAVFAVNLGFSGAAGDAIDAINLSIAGSDPAFVGMDMNGDMDFGRFTFVTSLPGFLATPFSSQGAALVFPDTGTPLTPSATFYALGTLTVDLAGLSGFFPLRVSLNGGSPDFATDASGTLDNTPTASFATEGLVQFAQPDGVPIGVSSVPEPSFMTLFAGMVITSIIAFVRTLMTGKGPDRVVCSVD